MRYAFGQLEWAAMQETAAVTDAVRKMPPIEHREQHTPCYHPYCTLTLTFNFRRSVVITHRERKL